MANVTDGPRWAIVAVLISLLMAGIGLIQFVLDPLKSRIDVARDNLRAEFGQLEHRLDQMDERLRMLERERR